MTGVELIAEERERQVSQENWSESHDDQHKNWELSCAAQAYLNAVESVPIGDHNGVPDSFSLKARTGYPPYPWPWAKEWWKPSGDHVRNLVKAGALIAAEIDRLSRVAKK